MPKLTPWYPSGTHPVRKGYYDRAYMDGIYRHYWDGIFWRSWHGSDPHWRQIKDYPLWRGLSRPTRKEK